jgi:hypothetical protein
LRIEIPNIGVVELAPSPDGSWEFECIISERRVLLDVNVHRSELTRAEADQIPQFLDIASQFDARAHDAFSAALLTAPDNAVTRYARYHVAEIPAEELSASLGLTDPRELSPAYLTHALTLQRIGLYPEQNDQYAVFDYSIDPTLTDYVLAVTFTRAGEIVAVAMEG